MKRSVEYGDLVPRLSSVPVTLDSSAMAVIAGAFSCAVCVL